MKEEEKEEEEEGNRCVKIREVKKIIRWRRKGSNGKRRKGD